MVQLSQIQTACQPGTHRLYVRGTISMYHGMFVLYKATEDSGHHLSMRFVGLDPDEPNPVLQSIVQIVPDGTAQIATFNNVDGLTDLLLSGNQLSWLSAEACIKGSQHPTVIESSSKHAGCTQLQVCQDKHGISVWSMSAASQLSHQELDTKLSYQPPVKKSDATLSENHDKESDRFLVLPKASPEHKDIVLTRRDVIAMLQQAQATLHAPEISAAREEYITQLNNMLQLYGTQIALLAGVTTAAKVADAKLSEVYDTLESHLEVTKVASTGGSVVSIIGTVMLFFPLSLPLGVALTVAGTATIVSASIADTFFFEPDASHAFQAAISTYQLSSKALGDRLNDIEKLQGKLIEFLTTYLTSVHRYPFPSPRPNARPNVPKGLDGHGFDTPHAPNLYSNVASKGLALRAADLESKALAKAAAKSSAEGAELIAKRAPKLFGRFLGKAVPILSIGIDIKSIVDTWKNDNETLAKAKQIITDISQNAEAFRKAVQELLDSLEEHIGSLALQDSLRRLLRLRGKPGGLPSGGSAMDPDQTCKMHKRTEKMRGIPFLLFASRQGQDHEDPTENSYVTDLVPETNPVQLSQKYMTAPVVDSLFGMYPNINPSSDNHSNEKDKDNDKDNDKDTGPYESLTFASFSIFCNYVAFGDERVHNVAGSAVDHRVASWVGYWKWSSESKNSNRCLDKKCYIELSSTIRL